MCRELKAKTRLCGPLIFLLGISSSLVLAQDFVKPPREFSPSANLSALPATSNFPLIVTMDMLAREQMEHIFKGGKRYKFVQEPSETPRNSLMTANKPRVGAIPNFTIDDFHGLYGRSEEFSSPDRSRQQVPVSNSPSTEMLATPVSTGTTHLMELEEPTYSNGLPIVFAYLRRRRYYL